MNFEPVRRSRALASARGPHNANGVRAASPLPACPRARSGAEWRGASTCCAWPVAAGPQSTPPDSAPRAPRDRVIRPNRRRVGVGGCWLDNARMTGHCRRLPATTEAMRPDPGSLG